MIYGRSVVLEMTEQSVQLSHILPATTKVWGFDGGFLGPQLEVRVGHPVTIRWRNTLPPKPLFPVMPGTLPDQPVRTTIHMHGAVVRSESDGNPKDWFVPGRSRTVQ